MRTPSGGSSPARLVVASRASRLALTQTGLVADRLRSAHPDLEVEILEVTTRGDRDQRPFAQIGGKGLFTTEVERAILDGRADVAVHSAKDLTAEIGPGCTIVCVPERASRADVVIGGTGDSAQERLRSVPAGGSIGTSSMRRRALLTETRRDLVPVEFRGNLDTRLSKVRDGVVQAAILAAAGLERLGVPMTDAMMLDPSWWVPAPGQGVLAVEGMADRDDLVTLFDPLQDPAAAAELLAERAFSARLEGGCSVPLGCSAVVDGDRISVTGYLGSLDGRSFRETLTGGVEEAAALGIELADAILVAGGDAVLAEIQGRSAPQVEEP
jgi:hydroxymethylbilane synthase